MPRLQLSAFLIQVKPTGVRGRVIIPPTHIRVKLLLITENYYRF